MLNAEIKAQLDQYIKLLEGPVVLKVSAGEDQDTEAFVNEIASMSDLITLEHTELPRTPSFTVGDRITFAGVPMGHEFTSFVMALLQVAGRKPKVDDKVIDQIKDLTKSKEIQGEVRFSDAVGDIFVPGKRIKAFKLTDRNSFAQTENQSGKRTD